MKYRKIWIEVEIPEGNTCNGCNFLEIFNSSCGRTEAACVLFINKNGDQEELDETRPYTEIWLKCEKCRKISKSTFLGE